MYKQMTARTRSVLALSVVSLAILFTGTYQVEAAELIHEATVQVSDNESVYNLSVFPGKAGYDNGTVSGVFGDGTVVDYRFFTADPDTVWSWIDGGEGRVADITSPPASNVAGAVNNSQNWPDVWVTSDPDTEPADFTTDTQAGAQNITGTIDVAGLGTGTLYFMHGTYHDSFVLALTMSGPGQADIQAEFADDPPNTVNMGWVTSFSFSTGGVYNTVTYSYTNTDADGSRARFMGVIVDGGDPSKAQDPTPENEGLDVSRDIDLSWLPGQFAVTHNLYVGETFEDVEAATVPTAADLSTASFDPGRLDFGQTYFWRVDEVNGSPDKSVFKGEIWSFEVEPYSIPIENVTASASSAHAADMGTDNTIGGVGLNELDQHSTEATEMWLSGMGDPAPWIQYEFDQAYKLHEMQVWNSNQVIESFVGIGAKDVVVETSVDGTEWVALAGPLQLAQAPGQASYTANTAIDFGAVMARYVRITVQSGYGMLPQFGLSEVRFYSIPVQAREPQPADGTVTASADVTLTWRAGREAVSHEVYLGTDSADLALVATVTDTSLDLMDQGLSYGSTYFWQINEVNEGATPAAHEGPVWSFSLPDFGTVDDFDQYDDTCKRIFFAWEDGLGHSGGEEIEGCDVPPSNGNGGGSIVGNAVAPFAEQTIVNGDSRQSLPFEYDNAFGLSETTLTLAGQDWTQNGVQTLGIAFRGTAGNTGSLYVKINNAKIVYDLDPADIARSGWQAWNIDLSAVGGVQNVTRLTIGVEGASAAGKLYIDDIRLYPLAGELITPVEPDVANLLVHLPLDGNAQDASGNNRHGSTVGGPIFVSGAEGQALEFDGVDDYVNIDGFKGITADLTDPANPVQQPFTISNWVRTTSDAGDTEMVTWGASSGSATRLTWRVHQGRLRTEHNAGNLRGNTYMNDGEWHHVALVVTEGANLRPENTKLYLDGFADSTFSGTDTTYKLVPEHDVRVGMGGPQNGRFFPGALDEIRIYDRALSTEEIRWLAGATSPIHKPF